MTLGQEQNSFLTSKCNSKELVIPLKCQGVVITVKDYSNSLANLK